MNPNIETKIETKIFARRDGWNDRIGIMVKHVDMQKLKVFHGELHWKEVPDGADFTAPTMQLDMTEAQRLMDELWNCGLRPSEGTGSAGSLEATQAHLQDMRQLVHQFIAPAAGVNFTFANLHKRDA